MAPSDRDNSGASAVEFVSETLLPTSAGSFRVRAYRDLVTGKEPVAVVEGDVQAGVVYGELLYGAHEVLEPHAAVVLHRGKVNGGVYRAGVRPRLRAVQFILGEVIPQGAPGVIVRDAIRYDDAAGSRVPRVLHVHYRVADGVGGKMSRRGTIREKHADFLYVFNLVAVLTGACANAEATLTLVYPDLPLGLRVALQNRDDADDAGDVNVVPAVDYPEGERSSLQV